MAIPSHQDKTLGVGCPRLQAGVGADSGDTEWGHGLGSSGGSRRPSMGEARPHQQVPVPLSHCPSSRSVAGGAQAGVRGEGEAGGGGGARSGTARAQECPASRSPAATRLMAPAQSQEQPHSPGSGNASRLASPGPLPCLLPGTLRDFLSLAKPGPILPLSCNPSSPDNEETPPGLSPLPSPYHHLLSPRDLSHLLLPPAHPQPSALHHWGPPCPGLSPA